jgi:hypothetical protein
MLNAMGVQTILHRRKKVAELYLNNVTQPEIAEIVGCGVATVFNDLKWLREQWLAKMSRDFAERKSEELAKIDRMEMEAWNAWEKSKLNKEKVYNSHERGRVSKRGRPLPPVIKVVKTVEGQTGDPRYLERIQWCIEMRLKLMGALAKDDGSDKFVVIDWQSLFNGRAMHQASQPVLQEATPQPEQPLLTDEMSRTRVVDPVEEFLANEERKVDNGSSQNQGD